MAQRQFRDDDTSVWLDRFGNGSDGAYAPTTGTDAPIDSACTGTASTTSLSATNASFSAGQLILIHQTRGTDAGVWELNKIQSYVAGTITTAYALTNTYSTGAQVMVLKQYSSANIASGETIVAKSYNDSVGGLFGFVCMGPTTVTGTISNNGANGTQGTSQNSTGGGFRGGGGTNGGAAAQGGSTLGVGSASMSANGSGGGGGQGGGGGGAMGALIHSVASLVTKFVFGGAGGGSNSNSGTGQQGANSGGIVLIISKSITVTGAIRTNGGAGSGNAGNQTEGSGGGAGGAILIKGQSVTLGSGLVTSSGGAGGVGGTGGDKGGGGGGVAAGVNPGGHAGGNGSNGAIHVDYSILLSGTTTPTLDSAVQAVLTDPPTEENYTLLM